MPVDYCDERVRTMCADVLQISPSTLASLSPSVLPLPHHPIYNGQYSEAIFLFAWRLQLVQLPISENPLSGRGFGS